jgi:hypothetical protein
MTSPAETPLMHENHDATDDATDALLQTARELGWGNARPGDVIAAAYRLAAAKLREDGSAQQAESLEAFAVQAERIS